MFQLLCSVAFFGLIVASPTSRVHDGRIVGGEDIDITEAPYQVSLLYRGRHSCGGTLVANDIVLTAAHCIMGSDPTNYQIRAGSSYNEREGVVYPVGEILAHPDFSFSKMDNDVAIVWLSQPVTFSDRIAVVEMASQGDEVEDGELTEVTGWGNIREGGGIPTMLQRVLVPKVNSMACGKAYAPMYTITPRMLCAGAPGGGKDACQGDSGGPLIHNGKLTGVVSWGLGCARPEYPGVYAKVAALRRWIDEHILYLRLKNIMRW